MVLLVSFVFHGRHSRILPITSRERTKVPGAPSVTARGKRQAAICPAVSNVDLKPCCRFRGLSEAQVRRKGSLKFRK